MTTSDSAFSLESDQLAFKGNDDYHMVLSSLAKLEAIRAQALTNLDRLHDLKKEALADPHQFIHKLQTNPKALNIPSRPKIPAVPTIDWSKYAYSATETGAPSQIGRSTRNKKVQVPQEWLQKSSSKGLEVGENTTMVRGRVKDDLKPETFNQLWTTEEQRRLEELLIEFPPERVEARRYRKIADKLGTKTLQQVASRIQKYFIRLAQCGLPVPGRVPNYSSIKKKFKHKHHLKNKPAMPSTFLQAYVPPVFMQEDTTADSISSVQSSVDSESDDSSDSDLDIPDCLKESEEYRELMSLRKLKEMKLNNGSAEHTGYKCDGCGTEPIIGVRYHCLDCPQETSIDFCVICNSKRITLANHRPEHTMSAIKDTSQEEESGDVITLGEPSTNKIEDKDYLPSKFNIPGHYNYLDPNYIPDSTH